MVTRRTQKTGVLKDPSEIHVSEIMKSESVVVEATKVLDLLTLPTPSGPLSDNNDFGVFNSEDSAQSIIVDGKTIVPGDGMVFRWASQSWYSTAGYFKNQQDTAARANELSAERHDRQTNKAISDSRTATDIASLREDWVGIAKSKNTDLLREKRLSDERTKLQQAEVAGLRSQSRKKAEDRKNSDLLSSLQSGLSDLRARFDRNVSQGATKLLDISQVLNNVTGGYDGLRASLSRLSSTVRRNDARRQVTDDAQEMIGLALLDSISLQLDSAAEDVSAAALNAAAAGEFTKEFTVLLAGNVGTSGSPIYKAHPWYTGEEPVITPAENVLDADVSAPTVTELYGASPIAFAGGSLTLKVTFDTDAGATKTYVNGEDVTVQIQVAADDLLPHGWSVAAVTKTYDVIA